MKLTESKLKNIIRESILNEISYKTLKSAQDKTENYYNLSSSDRANFENETYSRLGQAFGEIRDYLSYDPNDDYNKEGVNDQMKLGLKYLDAIKDILRKKFDQASFFYNERFDREEGIEISILNKLGYNVNKENHRYISQDDEVWNKIEQMTPEQIQSMFDEEEIEYLRNEGLV